MQWEQIGSNSDMSGDDFDFTNDAAMNKKEIESFLDVQIVMLLCT